MAIGLGRVKRAMGKVNLTIDDKLEAQLREKASKKFGMKRGYLMKGIEAAILEWVSHD